jgi:hypothetical protein
MIAGSVFIFSGFVKAIDPLGSAYKFHDYLQAFNIEFLQFLCLPLAIFLCTAEFISGFSVLTGFRQKTGIWGLFLLIVFFTPLTFILAITNPVSDCGCFGDAIHLTNWQTFGKNIVLLVLIIILFAGRKRVSAIFKPLTEWILISIIVVLFISFSLYNLRYLPIIDFLPYKIGTNIPEKMKMPEGVSADEYQSTFIYSKNGVNEKFTIDNFPANDSSWKFIEQRSILVKKGYEPPVHDFSITKINNEEITEGVLNDKGYTILMISKKLSQAKMNHLVKGFELGSWCQLKGMNFYILTASGTDEIKNFDNGLQFCLTDETTLKTVIRSNPGYVLLRNGTITGKWSWANLPPKEWFSNDITGKQIESFHNQTGLLIVIISFLSVSVLLMYLCILLKQKENT